VKTAVHHGKLSLSEQLCLSSLHPAPTALSLSYCPTPAPAFFTRTMFFPSPQEEIPKASRSGSAPITTPCWSTLPVAFCAGEPARTAPERTATPGPRSSASCISTAAANPPLQKAHFAVSLVKHA